MTTESNNNSGSSISFILFIVFLVLKLVGVIDWSWWWVTCPLWAGLVIIIAGLLGFGIIGALAIFIKALFSGK